MSASATLGRDRDVLGFAGWVAALMGVMAIPLIDLVGTAMAGLFTLSFLVMGAVIVLQRRPLVLSDLLPAAVPLTFILIAPGSDDPFVSVRYATILAITLTMPALIRANLTRDEFMKATALVLLVTFPLNFVFDPGWGPMIGMFGSKNFFALRAAMTVMFALWVVLNPGIPLWMRAGAAFVAVLAVVGMMRANSAGAVITGLAAAMVFLLVTISGRTPPLYRMILYAYLVFFCLVGGTLFVMNFDAVVDGVLTAFSKDAGLTGRDYLWLRAFQYIREHPVFGSGYSAFWVQGNVEAEGLWRALHISTRSGFHFHNLYINTTVETGIIGVTVTCFFLLCLLVRVMINSLRFPDSFAAVSLGLLTMFVMRSYVEVDFPGGFGYYTFLIGILWVYGRRDPADDPAEPVHQPQARRRRRPRSSGSMPGQAT